MRSLTISVLDEKGDMMWSFTGGDAPRGLASMSYLADGTQQQIIDALLMALEQARGQMRQAPEINIVKLSQ